MSHAPAVMLESPVAAGDHVRGPESAPVTLVEYGDFECHYCGRAYPVVKELERRLGDRLRFVFRHTPRTNNHPHAQHAAEAAEAAAAQGKFWEMHDRLFEHQDSLRDEDLASHASAIGLDAPRLVDALRMHVYAPLVHAQEATGAHSVLATPTFFINGVRFDDSPDLATLQQAIERAGAVAVV
jgi:formate-nitrite transporter family protein